MLCVVVVLFRPPHWWCDCDPISFQRNDLLQFIRSSCCINCIYLYCSYVFPFRQSAISPRFSVTIGGRHQKFFLYSMHSLVSACFVLPCLSLLNCDYLDPFDGFCYWNNASYLFCCVHTSDRIHCTCLILVITGMRRITTCIVYLLLIDVLAWKITDMWWLEK